MKATNVDGIYDKDPRKFDDAVMIKKTSYIEVLNKKLNVMDSTATSLCMEEGIPIIVFNINKKGNLKKVLSGDNIGTFVN